MACSTQFFEACSLGVVTCLKSSDLSLWSDVPAMQEVAGGKPCSKKITEQYFLSVCGKTGKVVGYDGD